MQFTDLKTQYQALKTDIDAGIQRVLDHGQYIMGPEVKALDAGVDVGLQHLVLGLQIGELHGRRQSCSRRSVSPLRP